MARSSTNAANEKWERWLSVGVGAVLLLAGAAKCVNFSRFVVGALIGHGTLADATAVGVVAMEGAVGATLVIAARGFVALVARGAAVAMLVFFMGALVMLAIRDVPDCGCLGVFIGHARFDAGHGVVRNLGLIVIALWLFVRAAGEAEASTRALARGRGEGCRAGFTLIELLVCIVIISIVIALAIPELGAARTRARHSRSLSLQRQLVAGTFLYANANAEAFPYLGTPGDPYGPIMVKGVNVQFQGYFTDQRQYWLSLIVPDYVEVNVLDVDHRDEVDPRGIIRTPFQLTEAVFADSRLFVSESEFDPPESYVRGTRHSEVAFPLRKGLTTDISLGAWVEPFDGPYLVVFADGSGRSYPGNTPSASVNQMWSNSSAPVLNTLHGLAGVDFGGK